MTGTGVSVLWLNWFAGFIKHQTLTLQLFWSYIVNYSRCLFHRHPVLERGALRNANYREHWSVRRIKLSASLQMINLRTACEHHFLHQTCWKRSAVYLPDRPDSWKNCVENGSVSFLNFTRKQHIRVSAALKKKKTCGNRCLNHLLQLWKIGSTTRWCFWFVQRNMRTKMFSSFYCVRLIKCMDQFVCIDQY